jgi:GTPase SAR1 family protein
MEDDSDYTEVKIVIIGNSGVGKTSMINRYLKKTFDENSSTTIGAMYLNKVVEKGDLTYKLQVSFHFLKIWIILLKRAYSDCDLDLGYSRTGEIQNYCTIVLQG